MATNDTDRESTFHAILYNNEDGFHWSVEKKRDKLLTTILQRISEPSCDSVKSLSNKLNVALKSVGYVSGQNS